MKKIIYAILGIFLMVACTDDHLEDFPTTPTEETGEKVKVTFSVQIPEAQTAVSRSFEEPAITSLHLAVFDANGYLSEVVEATRTQTGLGTADSPISFTVELSQTPNKRIIHFLANKTIDANDFGTESELIGALYTTGEQDAYWQRIELNEGISFEYIDENESGSYDDGDELIRNSIGDQLTKVPLIRNFAKITVQKATNMTTAGRVNFELQGFTVVNVPDRGSVAPIKTNGGGFAQYLNASKVPYNYNDLTNNAKGYIGFVPSETQIDAEVAQDTEENPFLLPNGVFYMYERNNQAKNENRTFVIIKGKFGDEDVSYYKVDLTYKDGNVTKYFEILRNFSYNIVIKNVESSGAASPELAAGMTGSHNNLSASIETQSLLNISDGAERLFVNYTEYVFVSSGEEMNLKYRYVPNISSPDVEDNSRASYSWVEEIKEEEKPVASITPISEASDDTQGWRTLTVTAATMNENLTKSQTLTLVAGNLSRTVKFILRPKYNFSNEMATSPTPNNTVKGTFTYSFTIPDNIPESLFPLTFVVQGDPENIYPNAERNSLPVQVLDGQQTFGYEREVTYEEYKQTGGIINCYFRVNTASYADTNITVSNKYFNKSKGVKLNNNNNIYEFSNLIVNGGAAVPYGAGTVTFTFNMPVAKTVTITAGKMSETPITSTTGTITAISRANNGFTYVPDENGPQSITFTTAEFASAGRILLKADNYITAIKAYDNVLKIRAASVTGSTSPELNDDSNIRVYASESDAIAYGDNHLAEVKRSILIDSQTDISLTGLTAESLVWFAYNGTDHIYVASATAEALASATANITFNDSYEIPLRMTVTYNDNAKYYGTNKTFTMTFTTNKSGKYKIESANFSINNVTIPSIFDASANTPITVTCTPNTWSEKAKITISHVEVDEDNEVSKTIATESWEGPTRQVLTVKVSKGNNRPSSNDTKVTMSTGSSFTQTYQWKEWAAGTEIEIENLGEDTEFTFTYEGSNRKAKTTAEALASGTVSLSFYNY